MLQLQLKYRFISLHPSLPSFLLVGWILVENRTMIAAFNALWHSHIHIYIELILSKMTSEGQAADSSLPASNFCGKMVHQAQTHCWLFWMGLELHWNFKNKIKIVVVVFAIFCSSLYPFVCLSIFILYFILNII